MRTIMWPSTKILTGGPGGPEGPRGPGGPGSPYGENNMNRNVKKISGRNNSNKMKAMLTKIPKKTPNANHLPLQSLIDKIQFRQKYHG